MASTKQRQEQARQRRRELAIINQANQYRNQWNEVISSIGDHFDIDPVSVKDIWPMFQQYANEYREDGHLITGADGDPPQDSLLRQYFIIRFGGEIAGFMCVRMGKFNHKMIEHIYILPKFRHKNISTVAYTWAIYDYGCDTIELAKHRVSRNLAYWRGLGFKYMAVFHYNSDMDPLVLLTTYKTDRGVPLADYGMKHFNRELATQVRKDTRVRETAQNFIEGIMGSLVK